MVGWVVCIGRVVTKVVNAVVVSKEVSVAVACVPGSVTWELKLGFAVLVSAIGSVAAVKLDVIWIGTVVLSSESSGRVVHQLSLVRQSMIAVRGGRKV